ncbi:hypothetical protein Tco_1249602 [Tanacetum coccineum]
MPRSLLLLLRIMIYGSHLLILSAYAPSMPPLISLPLSMACDNSDGHGGLKSLLKIRVSPVRAFIAFRAVILPFNIKGFSSLSFTPSLNEPPLLEGHTSGSGEGRMEHTFELMDNVLNLEKEKDAQAVEILKLKKRVKKLERKRKSSISHTRQRVYRQVESSDDDDLDEKDASK